MKETLRIEWGISVKDETGKGLESAQKKMTAFDKSNEKTQKRLDSMSRGKWHVVVDAIDRVTNVVSRMGTSVRSLSGKAWNITIGVIDKVTAPVKSIMSTVGSLLGAGTVASTVLGGMTVYDMLNASSDQNTVEKQLETVLANVSDSENAMDRLKTKASSLQSDTMYGDETYLAGAAELATYLSDVDALEKAMEVLSDYAAGMSGGAEVSIEQMVNYATQLGKALNGPDAAFDGLTKKGFAFSEAQEAILKSDLTSDMEKISVLAEVIGESWDGLAEAFANTPTARVTQFKNAWGDMKEVIGDKLYPSVGNLFAMLTTKIPGLQKILEKGASWLGNKIEEALPSLEAWIDSGFAKLESFSEKLREVFGSDRFQYADTFGKIKIAWDELIAKPFGEWWDSKGRAWFAEKMSRIGEGIGTGITVGLLGILGVDTKSVHSEGVSIGRSFMDGFSKGFDTDKIGYALQKWASNHKALTVAVGGIVGFEIVTGIASAVQSAMSAISVIKALVAALGSVATVVGVFVAVAAVIAGVTVALIELNKAETVEQREVQKMIEAHKELIDEYNRTVDSIEEEYDGIDNLVEQYERLSQKENRSTSEKAQLLAITEKLNELMPELGLQYDYYTDKVNGSAEAVKNLAKAEYMRKLMSEDQDLMVSLTEQNYKYADKATSLRSDIADYEKRIREAGDKLTEIQSKSGVLSVSEMHQSDKLVLEIADAQGKLKDAKAALSDLQVDWAVSSRELDNVSKRYAERAEIYDEVWNAYTGTGTESKHAWGGIIQSPHMAMVAEDGAEAIIPLSSGKRQRGISLWEDAGESLGVSASVAPSVGGGNVVEVNVSVSPEFVIEARDAGFDGESLVSIVREHIREMADDIGDEIADRLARVFSNMPVKGTA